MTPVSTRCSKPVKGWFLGVTPQENTPAPVPTPLIVGNPEFHEWVEKQGELWPRHFPDGSGLQTYFTTDRTQYKYSVQLTRGHLQSLSQKAFRSRDWTMLLDLYVVLKDAENGEECLSAVINRAFKVCLVEDCNSATTYFQAFTKQIDVRCTH